MRRMIGTRCEFVAQNRSENHSRQTAWLQGGQRVALIAIPSCSSLYPC